MVVLREGCTNGAGGEAEGHPDTLSACPGCTVSGTQRGAGTRAWWVNLGVAEGLGGTLVQHTMTCPRPPQLVVRQEQGDRVPHPLLPTVHDHHDCREWGQALGCTHGCCAPGWAAVGAARVSLRGAGAECPEGTGTVLRGGRGFVPPKCICPVVLRGNTNTTAL